MAPKIEDVARRAGVSTATVSRALSQPDLVRPETRDRVLTVVRELGYLPNAAARNLRSGTTMMALVVLPKLAHVFFGEVVRGIEHALAAAGYGLIVGDLDNLVDRERHVFRMASPTHVDGIILLTGRMLHLGDRSLAASGLPIVAAVARIDQKGLPNVLSDEKPRPWRRCAISTVSVTAGSPSSAPGPTTPTTCPAMPASARRPVGSVSPTAP